MRKRTIFSVLSAGCLLAMSACYPDYTFDLAELDGIDASAGDDAGGSTDGAPSEDAGGDAADGDLDGGTDGDAADDAGELDSGFDAGDGDAGPDADGGDSGPVEDGGDSGVPPPPEPDCSEDADGGALYACVPNAPSGWSGPVALYNDLAVLTPPPCPAEFFPTPVFEGHAQLATPPASCSACSCSVSGVTCSSPTSEQFFSGASCSGTCGWTPQGESGLKPGVCVGMGFGNSAECPPPTSVQLGESTPSGAASCKPSTQTPTKAPVAWADEARACHAPSSDKGCDSGFVCAPKASHPFEANLCIVRIGEGDVSCPAGPYSQKHVFYRDAVDSRSCTDCQCGSATNVRCEGELKTYASTAGCSNEDGSIPLGTCGNFPPAFVEGDGFGKWFRFAVQPKASCPASGGQAVGTVTPTRPQTICCMP